MDQSHSNAELFVALVLFGLACGPPKLAGDDDGEAGSSDDSTTTSSSSSSSSSETSTSGTDTSETSTSEPSTSETLSFIPELDVWDPDECDSFLQDCPDGEKCVPYGSTGGNWDSNKCVPVVGDQAAGEPCMYLGTLGAVDDCDATSLCWDVNQEDVGICMLFCTGTNDTIECPEGTQYLISNGFPSCLCIPTCDPLLQDCSEGLACYWANNGFNCIFTTEDIPPGEPCGFIDDCVEGNFCLDATSLPNCAGSACCSPFCEVGAGDQECVVLPGTTCVPFFEQGMAPPGYEFVGVCLLP